MAAAEQHKASEFWAAAQRVRGDCYDCLRGLALGAEVLGNRVQADRWYAEAVRQGPSLPQAENEWGRQRLARGDVAGALSLAETAHRKSPYYADALELWGEALSARRDYSGAAAKFAEAARLTPYWGRLHLEWGKALLLSGRTAEARREFGIASGLDLTAAARTELGAWLRTPTARR